MSKIIKKAVASVKKAVTRKPKEIVVVKEEVTTPICRNCNNSGKTCIVCKLGRDN